MFNSTILEVIIGLVFLYLLFSLLATFVHELFSTFLHFRSKHLKSAIQSMLDHKDQTGKELFDKFHNHPLIQSFLKDKGKSFPSYIDPKIFASIITEMYMNDSISKGKDSVKESIEKLPKNNYLRHILLKYIEKGEEKTQELEKTIEDWFNSVMERASGWYNRKTKIWTIFIALAIAISFNFDSIHVYQRLSKDSKVRQDLVQYANDNINKYADYIEKDTIADTTNVELLNRMDSLKTEINTIIDEEIASVEQMAGIGWYKSNSNTNSKNHFVYWFIKVIGWFITALAISLGAPFWFDLLNKVMKLRGTGKQEKVPGS